MKKLTVVLLFGITAGCTSGEIRSKEDQAPDSFDELTLVALEDGGVFYGNKIIPVASLCDEISSKYTSDNTSFKIELSEYVTTGEVLDIIQALQNASFQKIIISEDLSLKILQLELIGNGEVVIDDNQISISALHSHLVVLDRNKEIKAFLSTREQTSAEDVFFTQRMLAKNHIKTLVRK